MKGPFVQIKDTATVFTPAQAAAMQEALSRYPFDVRIVTSSTLGSRNAFDRFMQDQVVSPTMVVVGIDPAQHRTSVHYGKQTGIAEGEYTAIEEAGSDAFSRGDFPAGVVAILDRAAKVAHPALTTTDPSADGTSWVLTYGFGGLVVAVAVLVALVLYVIARGPRGRVPRS